MFEINEQINELFLKNFLRNKNHLIYTLSKSNIFVLEQAVGPGGLQTFSTWIAVKNGFKG